MKREPFESIQLLDTFRMSEEEILLLPYVHYDDWPERHRLLAEIAINRKLAELPAGAKVVSRQAYCDVRPDLSGRPWQLYCSVVIEYEEAKAA